jgi:glycerol-3-phosphate acyltransferase PlsY
MEWCLKPAAVIGIAYLLGSIPFGYLIVRAMQGADVRETGSGGTGATNVSRRAGKAAIAKLVSGWPIFGGGIGPPLQNAQWLVAAAAIAVIVGHIFPVWLRFRGGKGVATGVGVFLMLAPTAVAMAALVFVGVVTSTRYVSLGSILAAVAIPLFVLLQHIFVRPVESLTPILSAAVMAAALIVFAHRENIRRLIGGHESKFQ